MKDIDPEVSKVMRELARRRWDKNQDPQKRTEFAKYVKSFDKRPRKHTETPH